MYSSPTFLPLLLSRTVLALGLSTAKKAPTWLQRSLLILRYSSPTLELEGLSRQSTAWQPPTPLLVHLYQPTSAIIKTLTCERRSWITIRIAVFHSISSPLTEFATDISDLLNQPDICSLLACTEYNSNRNTCWLLTIVFVKALSSLQTLLSEPKAFFCQDIKWEKGFR